MALRTCQRAFGLLAMLLLLLLLAVAAQPHAHHARREAARAPEPEPSLPFRVIREVRALVSEASFPPTVTYLRKHGSTITILSALVLAVSVMLGRTHFRPPTSYPVPGFRQFGTRGGGAPRMRAGVKELVTTCGDDVHTMADVIRVSAAKHPNARCFGERQVKNLTVEEVEGKARVTAELGDYEWRTYGQAHQQVEEFAAGLQALGLRKTDVVGIYGNTCANWQVAAHGCFAAGVPITTVYATLGHEAIVYSLKQTESRVIVTDALLFKNLIRAQRELPDLEHVVVLTGGTLGDVDFKCGGATHPEMGNRVRVWRLTDVLVAGRKVTERKRLHTPAPEDVALIMYTSGSTGVPKGVVITHRNMVAAVGGLLSCIEPRPSPRDCYLAFLPLAHILEIIAEAALLYSGAAIGYGSPNTLTDSSPGLERGSRGDLIALRPTLLAAVPKIMDVMRTKTFEKVAAKSFLARAMFHLAYRYKRAVVARGGSTPVLDWLIFRRSTAAVLGGRVRLALSGGGPLAPETQRFMNVCMCCPVGQGYGLTETTCCGTVTALDDPSVGHVGAPVGCTMVKLVDWEDGNFRVTDHPNPRGEIVIAGPSVASGYFKLDEQTAEDFQRDKEGRVWFHTGDVGQWRTDGSLQIIGRKKALVKLSHGEYVSLGRLDAVFGELEFASLVCTYAEYGSDYVEAVVSVNESGLKQLADKAGADTARAVAELCADPRVRRAAMDAVRGKVREAKLHRWDTPRKLLLVPDEWTPESGLLTAALKLRREKIVERYAKQMGELEEE